MKTLLTIISILVILSSACSSRSSRITYKKVVIPNDSVLHRGSTRTAFLYHNQPRVYLTQEIMDLDSVGILVTVTERNNSRR